MLSAIEPISGPSLQQILLLVGVVVVGLGAVYWSWKRTLPPKVARRSTEAGPSFREQEKMRDEIERLVADLEQLSVRLTREVDAHVTRVRETIADAEARAARLMPSPVAAPPSPHAPIYALADRGLSAGDIARETGRPVGEIELILKLRVTV